jgi:type VI secretion system secreted protein Hcp
MNDVVVPACTGRRLRSVRRANGFGRGGSVGWWVVVACALGAAGMVAADTTILKLDGVKVDATDPNHDDWINLLAFGDGSVRGPLNPEALGGYKASPPRFSDIALHKLVDATSPILLSRCATGKHIAKAELRFMRASPAGAPAQEPYLTVTLNDVFVTSYSMSGGSGEGGGSLPMESISLNFSKCSVSYTDRERLTTTRAIYDVRTSTAFSSISPPTKRPPEIEVIPTAYGQAGLPLLVVVRVSDPDTPVGQLTVQASSSNHGLLPDAAIEVGDPGTSVGMVLHPSVGSSGVTTVTVRVSDADSTTETSFLAVFSPSSGPVLKLTDNQIAEHAPAGTAIGQLVLDPPPAPGAPPPFLLDSAAGRFRLEGDSLVVNDPLLLDFETSPRPTIVVGVPDPEGGPDRFAQFIIAVSNVAEGPYDEWRNRHFTESELLDPAISGPDADDDLDGLKHLLEYALGLPPRDGTDPGPGTGPRLDETIIEGKSYLTLVYRRRSPASDPDLIVTPQLSSDLDSWGEGPAHFVQLSEVEVEPDMVEITVRCVEPQTDGARQLIRLSVAR